MLAGFLHLSGRIPVSRGGIERCVRLPLLWSGSLGKVVVAVVAVLPSVDRLPVHIQDCATTQIFICRPARSLTRCFTQWPRPAQPMAAKWLSSCSLIAIPLAT